MEKKSFRGLNKQKIHIDPPVREGLWNNVIGRLFYSSLNALICGGGSLVKIALICLAERVGIGITEDLATVK